MSFFNKDKKKKEPSPQRQQMNMTLNLVIVLILIFLIVKMFKEAPNSGSSPVVTYAIAGVFCLAALAVIILTISRLVGMIKRGEFTAKNFLFNQVPAEEPQEEQVHAELEGDAEAALSEAAEDEAKTTEE